MFDRKPAPADAQVVPKNPARFNPPGLAAFLAGLAQGTEVFRMAEEISSDGHHGFGRFEITNGSAPVVVHPVYPLQPPGHTLRISIDTSIGHRGGEGDPRGSPLGRKTRWSDFIEGYKIWYTYNAVVHLSYIYIDMI